MAQIIPFSSRQAFGRKAPPTGNSAEILRTIYAGAPKPVAREALVGPGPYGIFLARNGKLTRLTGPFNDIEAARKELTKLQLRADPTTRLYIDTI